MPHMNRRIVLAARPQGAVGPEHFRLESVPFAPLAEGQVRVRNHFLSLDPYMRGRMNDRRSYAPPQPLDEVMIGGTVGEVIESRNLAYNVGDKVIAMFGWQEYGVSDGHSAMLRKLDDARVPLSAWLGVLGMPGVTGWYGLHRIIEPRAGETIVVSAASGAVGGVVGQLAKAVGCRVVGVAGGAEKCVYVVKTLGFDACVDYKGGKLDDDLQAAAPNGIDGYFDNVGGTVLDAVLAQMNDFGRIALCGMISSYDSAPVPLRRADRMLAARLTLRGFIVTEQPDAWAPALAELGERVANGSLRYQETIAQGIDNAPQAFIGLLKGRNLGKQLVRL